MHHPVDWHLILPHWLHPALLHAILVWIVILTFALIASKRLTIVPTGIQKVVEWFIDLVRTNSKSVVGPEHAKYDPLFISVFFFIFIGNLWGLVPGMLSPTANLNTNLGIATVVFCATHFFGIKKLGFRKYLSHFAGDVPCWMKPAMFCLEMVSHIARPLSLTFRLFGNIMAKEVLLLLLLTLTYEFATSGDIAGKILAPFPAIIYPLLLVLGAFLCYIQAFVFMLLTQVYIGGAVAEQGH